MVPHRPISTASYVAASYAGKSLQFVQKAAVPVAVFVDGVRIFDAIAEDEYSFGENTVTKVAIVGGEWAGATAGAWGGAKAGAGIGFLIAGPPGAGIGGVIGGIAGGIGGSYAGGYLMDVSVTKLKAGSNNNKNDRLK